VAARTITDAQVVDTVRDLAWSIDERTGAAQLTPEGLYGRRKMTALVRRHRLPEASAGSVHRAMRLLGLSGVRWDKKLRTTIPATDGKRAGDLLDRDFTAPAPNRVWVTDSSEMAATWPTPSSILRVRRPGRTASRILRVLPRCSRTSVYQPAGCIGSRPTLTSNPRSLSND
jgi:transposase InsO family protein